MEKRKVEGEVEARRLLAKAAKAGGDLKSFARARGIDGRSLNAWRMNLEQRAQPASRPRKPRSRSGGLEAPLRLVELVATSGPTGSARYTVRIGDAKVEVGDDFEAETLRRLLEVLRTC